MLPGEDDPVKHIIIDCETTGVDHKRHGLVQIAGSIFRDGKFVERFNFKLAPYPNDQIDQEALDANGLTREQLATFEPPRSVYQKVQTLLGRHVKKYDRGDKFHFVGYNGNFDADHIREFFVKNGDSYFGSWFWYPILDVSKLAGIRLQYRRHEMANFQLMTVAKFLGIEVDPAKAHDAEYDVRITGEMFNLLCADLGAAIPKLEGF
jgi:DNA polymerase-3 subunit epsilon